MGNTFLGWQSAEVGDRRPFLVCQMYFIARKASYSWALSFVGHASFCGWVFYRTISAVWQLHVFVWLGIFRLFRVANIDVLHWPATFGDVLFTPEIWNRRVRKIQNKNVSDEFCWHYPRSILQICGSPQGINTFRGVKVAHSLLCAVKICHKVIIYSFEIGKHSKTLEQLLSLLLTTDKVLKSS